MAWQAPSHLRSPPPALAPACLTRRTRSENLPPPPQVLGQVYVNSTNIDDDLVNSIALPAEDPNAPEVGGRRAPAAQRSAGGDRRSAGVTDGRQPTNKVPCRRPLSRIQPCLAPHSSTGVLPHHHREGSAHEPAAGRAARHAAVPAVGREGACMAAAVWAVGWLGHHHRRCCLAAQRGAASSARPSCAPLLHLCASPLTCCPHHLTAPQPPQDPWCVPARADQIQRFYPSADRTDIDSGQ